MVEKGEERWQVRGAGNQGLDFPPICPHVSPGWCLGSRPVPGGCWLGPEELLLGGGRTHAARLPHAHDPLSAYRESKEERQGWDSSLRPVCPIPSLDPNPSSAPFLPHTCSCPALPETPKGLTPSFLLSLRHVLLSLLLLSQPGGQLRQSLLCHWHRPPVWDHDIRSLDQEGHCSTHEPGQLRRPPLLPGLREGRGL